MLAPVEDKDAVCRKKGAALLGNIHYCAMHLVMSEYSHLIASIFMTNKDADEGRLAPVEDKDAVCSKKTMNAWEYSDIARCL